VGQRVGVGAPDGVTWDQRVGVGAPDGKPTFGIANSEILDEWLLWEGGGDFELPVGAGGLWRGESVGG